MNFILEAGQDKFDLWQAIKDYFNPDLSIYKSFDFGSGGMVSLHVIVFGLFIGIMISAVYAIYTKKILGRIVRKMLEEDILSPEKAKTLEELGFEKNYAVISGLRGYTLGRVVSCVEKDEFIENTNRERKEHEELRATSKAEKKKAPPRFKEPKFKADPKKCRYYIAEKDKYTAEMRFEAYGSGYGTFFFTLLMAIIGVIAIYGLLPAILSYADKVFYSYSPEANIGEHVFVPDN